MESISNCNFSNFSVIFWRHPKKFRNEISSKQFVEIPLRIYREILQVLLTELNFYASLCTFSMS